ncbi:MAG: transposase [Acidobacteria bacterium]|nr:transposase [Acidobacteriota bacterium]
MVITEKTLRENSVLVKAFTGLPAEAFWELVNKTEVQLPDASRERQRHERPDRQRAIGGGRDFDQPVAIRVAQTLTYLRLHIPQETVALLFGATQTDVSRDLRRLLPLVCRLLPAPEVWQEVAEGETLTAAQVLELTQLADGRALVDATEQRVYRSQDSEVRKAHYSGKKKAFTLKTQFVTDGEHHIAAISEATPGAKHDKKLSDEVKTVERLPDGCEADADKGYQGLADQVALVTVRNAETGEEQHVPRLTVQTPIKKPKGQELTDEQKAFNRQLGAIRVRVEHCIGWVKNWAIIATRFRCAHSIYTRVMQVVCGLVNWQTQRWQAAQAAAAT